MSQNSHKATIIAFLSVLFSLVIIDIYHIFNKYLYIPGCFLDVLYVLLIAAKRVMYELNAMDVQ